MVRSSRRIGDNEGDPLLGGKSSSGSIGTFGVLASVVAIIGISLAITFAVLYGNAVSKPTYARSWNNCLYSTNKVLQLQQKTTEWYNRAYSSGGLINTIYYGWERFQPTQDFFAELYNYTSEEDSLANHVAFAQAVELRDLAVATQADPNVGELESIGINFILKEVDLWLNNTRINWYHNSFGSAFFGVSWDIHLLEAWTIAAIFLPEFAAESDYGAKVNAWLDGYNEALPKWTAYYQAQADATNPHVHANVTIAEWSATWTFFATPGDFATNVCNLIPDSGEKADCIAKATISDGLNADFLAVWDGAYGTLAASLRPDSNPGLGRCHLGNESYSYWVKYHTELFRSGEDINAEGLTNVAETQANINAAMQRLSPPQTVTDFITRSNNCSDPDFWFKGGLDTCVENPLGDRACHKEFIDAMGARFMDILNFIPEVDGYLGRNSYTHRTDGTGGTYTFGGQYDPERSLYLTPSTINWGWQCVDGDGYKRFDTPISATTTLIHEGVPGHQAQLPLQGELICQVSNLTASTAWFEGWGLWSEGLGFVMGVTDDTPLGLYQNPYAEAGRWSANLLRTVRLVVDPKLHVLGDYSYLDCANYFGSVGLSYSYGLYECSRYITMPAQATAYWLGKEQFQELATLVQTALGADFDYREFILLVSKFGGLGLFSDMERIFQTYILWKQKDPAAITSFGYKFFVNDFYRQAAPIVAKGGQDLAASTAVPPGAKKRAVAAKKPRASVRIPPTKKSKSMLAPGAKLTHVHVTGAKKKKVGKRVVTFDGEMKKFHPPFRFAKTK